jgi:hypothetical protein
MHRCGLPVIFSLMAPMAMAQDFTPDSLWGLRAGLGSDVTPKVRETIEPNAGGETVVNWGSADSQGRRFHVGLWNYRPAPNGFLVGVEVAYTTATLGGSSSFAGSQGYRKVSGDLLAGWQWGLTGERGVRGHVEVTPLVGIGQGWLTVGDARALTYEYGLRTGAFIDERGWTVGALLSYIRGWSTISTSSATADNTLKLTAEGFRFGLEAGYSF